MHVIYQDLEPGLAFYLGPKPPSHKASDMAIIQ